MKQISIPLTLSLVTVAFVIGSAVGYYISPQYQNLMYDKSMET